VRLASLRGRYTLASGELMLDTFGRLVFPPGDTAVQSLVNIEFRDADGRQQTRTLSLLDAMALARALVPVARGTGEGVDAGGLSSPND
jgi:hypothetical protein